MKRFLIVLSFFLFLTLPSFKSKEGLGVDLTVFAQTATTSATPTAEESAWAKFWNWVAGIFIKSDYEIVQRNSSEINSDMTEYGNAADDSKHSSSGTRLTDVNSQTCYKGNVIKKVILEEDTVNYSNSDLAQICFNSANQCIVSSLSDSNDTCKTITIKDLAHYLVQINKKFYCENNKLITINSNIINQVNSEYSESIDQSELSCYQSIYQDLYLIPKNNTDAEEENSTNIVKTPLPANGQTSVNSINDAKNTLNQNMSPSGTDSGLDGLNPDGWQI